MEPEEYAKWIKLQTSWGGCPELKILCKHFNKMIYVVDINEEKIHKFDDTENKNEIIFLIYNGLHYNLGIY